MSVLAIRPWMWAPLWVGLWLLLTLVALRARSLLPVDETRYLAVAWDMWRSHHFLVPYLNGQPYSDKPPLLFWLIHLGWILFGVNEWWPRLISPFAGLGCLILTGLLARRLWPEDERMAALAPLVLLGGFFWAVFTTAVMFDTVLALIVLVGLLGLLEAWRRPGLLGFGLVALAIGLGVLAKGPVVALHLLPPALLAPLWGPRLSVAAGKARERSIGGWVSWYLRLAGALAIGAALALSWAIPAGMMGGDTYREAIFWRQSAGRVVSSFAHERPWWWLFAILPAMILPWTIWPPVWRAVRAHASRAPTSGSTLFALCWMVPAFVAFSAISGKQPHYVLPELPALSLLISRVLTTDDGEGWLRGWDGAPPALLFALIGLFIAFVPLLGLVVSLPVQMNALELVSVLVALSAAALIYWLPAAPLASRVFALTTASLAVVSAVQMALSPILMNAYDLRSVAARLAAWEEEGYDLASEGSYNGQFDFLGRLSRPVAVLEGRAEQQEWLATHPKSKVITYPKARPACCFDLAHRYRGRWIVVYDGAAPCHTASEPVADEHPARSARRDHPSREAG